MLKESVLEHVNVTSGSSEEVAAGLVCSSCSRGDALHASILGGEHILWAVNIGAESEIVHFSLVALIEVLSNDEIIDLLLRGVEGEVLEHSLELLCGDMARLGPIKILEARLEEHSVGDDLSPHLSKGRNH